MSDLARDLTLNFHWRDMASGPAAQFSQDEKKRIRELQAEQDKADAAYIRAVKMKLLAEKQLEDEKLREQQRTHREANALLNQFTRDEERANRQIAAEKKRLNDAASRAWKEQHDFQYRQAMQAWQDEQAAIKAADSDMAKLVKTGLGLMSVHQIVTSMGEEFKRSAEYVASTAKEFANVRQALQQVAALRGETNSNQFTLGQLDRASEAGLLPDEWRRAQEAFLNPAGAQVGDQPGAKMSVAEAETYQMRVARLARSKGIDPSLAMEAAGSILEQSKGHLTPSQAMAEFNPGFSVLEKSRIDLGRAMPMMSQLVSHGGMSFSEAAQLLAIVAPASPGQEAVGVEGALRALEEMQISGKGKEFGVTAEMRKPDALKAFAQNIAGREKALKAAGKSDEEIEVEIARQLKTANIAGDIRERRGLIRGIVRQGIELGGFERYEAVAKRAGASADIEAVREFERSDAGQSARSKAILEIETARAGYHDQAIKAELEKGEATAIRERQFEQPRLDMKLRDVAGWATGVDARQQIINENTIQALRHRALYGHRINHDSHAQFQADRNGVISARDVAYRSQSSVNEEIRELLKLLVDAEQKKAEERKRKGEPPLVRAHPAMPGPVR